MAETNILASRLRNLREEKNLTRQQLSDLINIPYQSILNYELGRRTPNAEALASFEKFFCVSGNYLCGKTDIREPMIWDDQEVMEAIKDNLPDQLSILALTIAQQSQKNQKLIFDILVEMKSILNTKDLDEKDFYIDLLHESIFALSTVRNRTKNKKYPTKK